MRRPQYRDSLFWKDVIGTAGTLSLAVFGGGVFPLPYAFRILGICAPPNWVASRIPAGAGGTTQLPFDGCQK